MVTTPLVNVLAGMRHASRRYGRPPAANLPDLVVTITPDTRAFLRAAFDAEWARYGWERPPRPEVRE